MRDFYKGYFNGTASLLLYYKVKEKKEAVYLICLHICKNLMQI